MQFHRSPERGGKPAHAIAGKDAKARPDVTHRNRLPRPRRTRRLRANREGTTAIEFALVAVPFLALIFGLLEVCMIFIVSTTLEHGAEEAARRIRVGQFQGGSVVTKQQFMTDVCERTFGLLDCTNNLQVEVDVVDSFQAAADPSPIDTDGNFVMPTEFDAGAPDDIVVVRVYYTWELITPLVSAPLANMNGNKRLIQSTVAFKNEPFN